MLTYRTVKGTPLTFDELDENFRHLDESKAAAESLAASGGAGLVGFIQAGDGAFARTLQDKGRERASAEDFFLAGEATQTQMIQRAIDAIYAAGGGEVLLTAKEYVLGASTKTEVYDNAGVPVSANLGCLVLYPNVSLKGKGKGVTILKPNSAALTCIWHVSPQNCSVTDLTIDSQWNGVNGAGHGIFTLNLTTAETDQVCRNVTYTRMEIKNVASYGIGVQNGDIENLTIERNHIENTGADGIDVKGRGPSGGDQPQIFVVNNHIRKIGMRTNLNDQTGIDIRGFAYIAGNTVELIEAAAPDGLTRSGIRLRPAGATETYGGAKSRVIGNHVRSNFRASTRGISNVADDVIIAFNIIEGCQWGVRNSQDSSGPSINLDSKVIGNIVNDCQLAYASDASVERTTFIGNTGFSCTEMYRLDGNNATAHASRAFDCATFLRTAGNTNVVDGGRISGAVTTRINDTGVGNKVRGVDGVRTKNRLQTTLFAVDTVSTKTITQAHSLNVVPTTGDVILSLVASNSEFGYRNLYVESVDAANVVIKLTVDRAGLAGDTARVVIDINTERL